MKKWLISIVLLLWVSGCTSEQITEVVSKLPDPNTLAAIGDTAGAAGVAMGRPELIAGGIVLSGIALIIRKLLKGKK